MSVMVNKSACMDCNGKDNCQRLNKLYEMCGTKRSNPRRNDIFDVIVLNCSLKNYDRTYTFNGDGRQGMYYCTICGSMHHGKSRIGMLHRSKIDNNGIDNNGIDNNGIDNNGIDKNQIDNNQIDNNDGEINKKET